MSFLFAAAAHQAAIRMKEAEAKLLKLSLRFGVQSSSSCKITISNVEIPRAGIPLKQGFFTNANQEKEPFTIRTIEISNEEKDIRDKKQRYPLVLLHGYMNGAAYFYRNFCGLSAKNNTAAIYSLDWLGWGLSSRPNYSPRDNSVETSEAIFVESLEAWRKAKQLDKMILAGHSMGGYLSVAYCERYPERVERLILLSPVGVPPDQQRQQEQEEAQWSMRQWFYETLFRMGATPSTLLRNLPTERSRGLIHHYVKQRLPAITDEEERGAVTDYLFYNMILPTSGEHCVSRLLTPFAYAKKPLWNRIPNLNVKYVSMLYGRHDWMDPKGGLAVQQLCNQTQQAPNVDVHIIADAGHLLMLDNWSQFNDAMIKSIEREIDH